MPKDTPKTGPRSPGTRRGGRVRSGLRRRGEATFRERLADLYRSPVAGWGVIIAIVAATAAAGIAIWTRERPLVSVGRVMNETRLVRVPFTLVDTLETEKKRESVRLSVPGVYVADLPVLAELRSSLENLPRTLASVSSLADVEAGIRERFRLTEEGLAAVQAEAVAGEPSPDYLDRVHAFMAILERTPLLGRDEWQRWSQSITRRMELRLGPGGRVEHEADRAVNIDDAEMLRAAIDEAARLAGFARPMRQVIVGRLSSSPRATFRYDAAATEAKRNAAAEAVEPIVNEWPVGAVIYSRGYALTPAQYEVARAELEHFAADLADLPAAGQHRRRGLRRRRGRRVLRRPLQPAHATQRLADRLDRVPAGRRAGGGLRRHGGRAVDDLLHRRRPDGLRRRDRRHRL